MQLLEHRGKQLLREAGIAVPRGAVATAPDEAERIARDLGREVMVKAQVATGGRGKAGGIVRARADRVREAAERLLGARVGGHTVSELLVEERVEARRELFLALVLDPAGRRPLLLVSGSGGVDVEHGAAEHIGQSEFSLMRGLQAWHIWRACDRARLRAEDASALVPVAKTAYGVFAGEGAQLLEINPLLVTGEGLVAADARVIPDPTRAESVDAKRFEREASELGFDFIELDRKGDVGLITTGAGASMLLIDLLRGAGAQPINFCDLRTGSLRGDPARLVFALRRLREYERQAVIAINVFAGITNLAEFAELLLRAIEAEPPGEPIVVRIEGRNAQEARRRLTAAGLECVSSIEALVEAVSGHLAADRAAGPLPA